jgi:hypothetical protein
MSDNKKPAAKVTLFPVSAAIWRNVSQKGDVLYSVTYQCSFKNSDGKWDHSSNFGRTESLLLSKVADLAHSKICELESADRKAQPDDQAA